MVKELAKFQEFDIRIEQVERLHAKVYLNEREAVLTSYNLVKGSHDSVEMGMHISDAAMRDETLRFLQRVVPALSELNSNGRPRASTEIGVGFCAGCGDADHDFNEAFPFCGACYRKTKRGKSYTAFEARVCHSCGKPNGTTVKKPVCLSCYRMLHPRE